MKISQKYNEKHKVNIWLTYLGFLRRFYHSFHRLYFNEDGVRYGWLCGCPWDPEYGLSIFLSGNEIEIGTKEDLFD